MSTRVDCLRCRRPEPMCICDAVITVANRTGITILQHPAERAHPFNTARLAKLGLSEVAVQIAWDGSVERPDLPEGTALLFPRKDAADLATVQDKPTHLVVLDGTWPQAKVLYKLNPWLADLPHVALSPEAPSNYRIRREPALHCLSTIESIAAALQHCEPDTTGLAALLDGFTALIDGQIAHRSTTPRVPRRPKRRTRVPIREQLRDLWEQVVIVYAETTPLQGHRPEDYEVMQWSAVRPASGETFDALATPKALPNPCVLEHMDLPDGAIQDAGPFSRVRDRWEAWAREDDIYVAWNRNGAVTGFHHLGRLPKLIHLKSVYCNVRKGQGGTQDQILHREGVPSEPVNVRGRAAVRLGHSVALARFLQLP